MKNAVIVVLTVALCFTCYRLVVLENQRYAFQLGMCKGANQILPDLGCIEKQETRTHWTWHLFHALVD